MKRSFKNNIQKKFSYFLKDKLNLLLVFILVIGFLLRFLGVYPGYNIYHPDEGKAGYSSATYMLLNKTLELPHYHYPALIPLTELIFLIIFFLPIVVVKIFLSQPVLIISHLEKLPILLQEYLAGGAKDIWLLYWSRYLTAFFSFLTLVLTYLVGKNLFSSRLVGIMAALVLAVNFRAVSNGQVDLPDTYNAFYLILAFFILLNLKNKPTLKWYILSGIALGLSLSAKLQFFIFLPAILIHLYLALKEKGFWEKVGVLFSKKIFFSVVPFLLVVLLINIGPLSHLQEFRETMSYQSSRYGIFNNSIVPISLAYFYQTVLTPAVLATVLLGLLVGLWKYKFPTFLVLSLLLPYLYYFFYLTKSWTFPRNFTSIMPLFALISGLGLLGLWIIITKFVRWKLLQKLLFFLIVILVISQSAKDSFIHTFYYMKPWSLVKMRQCLDNKVPKEVIIASHPWDVHTLFSLSKLIDKKKLSFVPLDTNLVYSAAELRETKADYALIGLDMLSYANSNWWMENTEIDFWQKPIDISKNTFSSLAALELFQYTLCSEVKPWQAVDNNYVFSRIPKEINIEGKQIFYHNFDKETDADNWRKIDGFGGIGQNLVWDKSEGYKNKGSLQVKSGHTPYPVIRWVSPVFDVKESNLYEVKAWIKADGNIDIKERVGFLRLDFYIQQPQVWNENTQSLSVALSSRYFGEGWKMEKVFAAAPKGAKFASVSFQTVNPRFNFWLDDIEILEDINEKGLVVREPGEYWVKVNDNVLIPNLGGGY